LGDWRGGDVGVCVREGAREPGRAGVGGAFCMGRHKKN